MVWRRMITAWTERVWRRKLELAQQRFRTRRAYIHEACATDCHDESDAAGCGHARLFRITTDASEIIFSVYELRRRHCGYPDAFFRHLYITNAAGNHELDILLLADGKVKACWRYSFEVRVAAYLLLFFL